MISNNQDDWENTNNNDNDNQNNFFNIDTIALKSINQDNDSNGFGHENYIINSINNDYENVSIEETLPVNISINSLGNSSINANSIPIQNKTPLLLSSLQMTQMNTESSSSSSSYTNKDLALGSYVYSPYAEFPLSSFDYKSINNFHYKEYARVLEYVFTDSKYDKQLYSKLIKTFTYFSTVKNITPHIMFNDAKYTSDHPWGSLIRTYQMLIAKFFLDIQIQRYVTNTLQIDINHISSNPNHLFIDDATLSKIKYELLLLFSDSPILISNVLNIDYYTALINAMPLLLQEYALNDNDDNTTINPKNEINKESFKVNKLLSPLSIGLITTCHKYLLSSQVEFNEPNKDLNHSVMIDIIKEIITQFSLFNRKIEIILFDYFISEEVIMNRCFVKFNDNICIEDIDMFNKNETIQYKEREYYIRENISTLLFVDINLADKQNDNEINSEYLNIVSEVFKIRNNLGFIGCLKKSISYMYFIGETKGKLIGLNPNKSRDCIKDSNEYFNTDVFLSFLPNNSNITLVSLKELSPNLMLCFQFKSIKEYKDLIYDLKNHAALEKKLFAFEEVKSISNMVSSLSIDFSHIKLDDNNTYNISSLNKEDNKENIK